MPIWDGGTNYIVLDYPQGAPCTFEEIYNFDPVGCSKQGDHQYKLTKGVSLVSGYFADTSKQVEFTSGRSITVASSAHFRLGEVDSVAKQTGKNGCDIIFHPHDGADVFMQVAAADLELYNSQLICDCAGNRYGHVFVTANDGYTFRLWGTRIRGGDKFTVQGSYADGKYALAGTDIEDFKYGMEIIGSFGPTFVTATRIIDCEYAMYLFQSHGMTVYNLEVFDCDCLMYFASSDGIYNLINCVSDIWVFYNIGTSIVKCQYTLDIKTVTSAGNAIGGANVKLWGAGGGVPIVDVDTYPVGHVDEGEISTQIITDKEYTLGGSITKNPYDMAIKHYEYKPYLTKVGVVELIDYVLALSDDPWITKNETQAGLIGGTCG